MERWEIRNNILSQLWEISINFVVIFSLLIVTSLSDIVRENISHVFQPFIPSLPYLFYPMKRVRKI